MLKIECGSSRVSTFGAHARDTQNRPTLPWADTHLGEGGFWRFRVLSLSCVFWPRCDRDLKGENSGVSPSPQSNDLSGRRSPRRLRPHARRRSFRSRSRDGGFGATKDRWAVESLSGPPYTKARRVVRRRGRMEVARRRRRAGRLHLGRRSAAPLSLSLSLSLSGVFERAGREHRRYSRIGVPANAHSFLKITPGGDDAADRIEKVGGPLRGGSHRNAPRVCLKVLAIANHGRD